MSASGGALPRAPLPRDDGDVVRANAAYWEQLAAHRPGCPVEDILAGRAMEPEELEVLGDLAGLRCLHLACSVADESLQMALAGARVTGVDIAPAHLATGREKARALGLDVDLRLGDMTALPPDLAGFDVVYISWGGLCWVPDLDAWVRDMAGRLLPGGRLVIAEHHPLWEVLSVTDSGDLRVNGSYLDPSDRGEPDQDKDPEVLRTLDEAPGGAVSFVWSLGAVVTAMASAGLVVTTLREEAHPEMYAGARGAERLPAVYVAVATRSSGAADS